MADNSGSYSGVSTEVLKGGLEPLNAYLQLNSQKEAEKLQQQKLRDAQSARRDKQLEELNKWSPDQAWEPFNQQVLTAAETPRKKAREMQLQGYTPMAISYAIQKDRDKANLLASKSLAAKQSYESLNKEWESNEMLNADYYKRKTNDIFFENGNFLKGKALNELDLSAANALLDDTKGYNREAIAEKVVKDLPEMISKRVEKQNNDYGYDKYKIVEEKSNILGEVKNGRMTVKITPEFEEYARVNPYVDKILKEIEDSAPTEAIAKELKMQTLKDMFGKYAMASSEEDYKSVKTKNAGDGDSEVTPDQFTRYQTIRDAVYDGDIQAIAAANNFINGVDIKFGGNEFLPGMEMTGKKPDRITITVQPNSEYGEPRTETYMLRTPKEQEKALFALNNWIDKSQPAKYKLGADKFMKIHQDHMKQDPFYLKGNDPFKLNK